MILFQNDYVNAVFKTASARQGLIITPTKETTDTSAAATTETS